MSRRTPLQVAQERAEVAECNRKASFDRLLTGEANRRTKALANSFRNTRRGRLRAGARPPGGSGNAHRDTVTRERLRKDCQDLYRDRPVIQTLVNRKAEFTVGLGPTLNVESEDKDFNREAEALFADWSAGPIDATETYGLLDLLEQAVVSACTDGRVAWLLTNTGRVQVLEDERIHNPSNQSNNETFVNGVEIDSSGRPIHYHIAQYSRDGSFVSIETDEVAARFIVPLINPLCRVPNVLAPEPALQSIIPLAEHLDETIESTIIALRIATLFGFVTSTQNPGDMQAQLIAGLQDTTDTETAATGDASEYELLPGLGMHIGAGETITQLKPEHPGQNVIEFSWMIVQEMAAVLGLPLDITHFIMDRNWSGTRSRLAVAWRATAAWHRMLHTACGRLSRWKVAGWINDGSLTEVRGWDRHRWIAPPIPQLDPGQEIKTMLDATGGLFKTHQQALYELGSGDFEDLMARIDAERTTMKKYGIEVVRAGDTSGDKPGDETSQGTPKNTGS